MAKIPSAAALAKEFAEVNRKLRAEREAARRTLSPAQLLQGIKSGQVSPGMAVLIGKKADGTAFTAKDLKDFAKSRDKAEKNHGKHVGVTIDQLIAASRPNDIKRANGSYSPPTPNGWVGNLSRGAARLYRVNGGILTFDVKASGDGPDEHYQVRVKAVNWESQLTNPNANPRTAVTNALNGPVMIDCNCKRHQFWYRYLAGVGRYALTPPVEKDFPKVRNPDLTGAVCKHTVAVFQSIRTPTYIAMLSKKMEQQRKHTGFGIKKRASNLTKAEIAALGRSRPRKTDHEKYKAKIQQAVSKAIGNKKEKSKLKAEIKKLEARKRKLNKEIAAKEKKVSAARSVIKSKNKDDAKSAISGMLSSIMEKYNMTESEAAAFIVSELGARNE